MCQHSWYDKNRRHYGRKPNTRRERGLRRRDFGIKHGPHRSMKYDNMQPVESDKNVKQVPIPNNVKVIKRYAKIYNWYVQHYEKYGDKKKCMEATAEKFGFSLNTIKHAINVCKYILATSIE